MMPISAPVFSMPVLESGAAELEAGGKLVCATGGSVVVPDEAEGVGVGGGVEVGIATISVISMLTSSSSTNEGTGDVVGFTELVDDKGPTAAVPLLSSMPFGTDTDVVVPTNGRAWLTDDVATTGEVVGKGVRGGGSEDDNCVFTITGAEEEGPAAVVVPFFGAAATWRWTRGWCTILGGGEGWRGNGSGLKGESGWSGRSRGWSGWKTRWTWIRGRGSESREGGVFGDKRDGERGASRRGGR